MRGPHACCRIATQQPQGYRYLNRNCELLPEDLEEKIFNHPRRSLEMVQKKFRNLPDIVGQMILGHHELFSGRGYPRQLRSELTAPLVRILALAVDVFEKMKKSYLEGDPIQLNDAVNYFLQEPVEPHLRRHGLTLCREVMDYLEGEDKKAV